MSARHTIAAVVTPFIFRENVRELTHKRALQYPLHVQGSTKDVKAPAQSGIVKKATDTALPDIATRTYA